jgi:hypothetical protein
VGSTTSFPAPTPTCDKVIKSAVHLGKVSNWTLYKIYTIMYILNYQFPSPSTEDVQATRVTLRHTLCETCTLTPVSLSLPGQHQHARRMINYPRRLLKPVASWLRFSCLTWSILRKPGRESRSTSDVHFCHFRPSHIFRQLRHHDQYWWNFSKINILLGPWRWDR